MNESARSWSNEGKKENKDMDEHRALKKNSSSICASGKDCKGKSGDQLFEDEGTSTYYCGACFEGGEEGAEGKHETEKEMKVTGIGRGEDKEVQLEVDMKRHDSDALRNVAAIEEKRKILVDRITQQLATDGELSCKADERVVHAEGGPLLANTAVNEPSLAQLAAGCGEEFNGEAGHISEKIGALLKGKEKGDGTLSDVSGVSAMSDDPQQVRQKEPKHPAKAAVPIALAEPRKSYEKEGRNGSIR